MVKELELIDFIEESNKIEGINSVRDADIIAHSELLSCTTIAISDLERFVKGITSVGKFYAKLRCEIGMDVRVGSYFPPPGGPELEDKLTDFLNHLKISSREVAYRNHIAYENLHPFMDGNGRSGRALWLWQQGGIAPIGFLHQFYYDTLKRS